MSEHAEEHGPRPHDIPPPPGGLLTVAIPSENLTDMPRRFTVSFAVVAALPLAVLALSPAAQPAGKDDPKPAKLERKNFTERSTGFKTDENTKRRIDMKSEFEMVF